MSLIAASSGHHKIEGYFIINIKCSEDLQIAMDCRNFRAVYTLKTFINQACCCPLLHTTEVFNLMFLPHSTLKNLKENHEFQS